jgi:hypothetical protein
LIEHQFGWIVNSIEGRSRPGNQSGYGNPSVRSRTETGDRYLTAPRTGAAGRATRKEVQMSILSSIGRIAAEFSAARARHQAVRTIRALPPELQKDIGWPDAFELRIGSARGVGTWAGSK